MSLFQFMSDSVDTGSLFQTRRVRFAFSIDTDQFENRDPATIYRLKVVSENVDGQGKNSQITIAEGSTYDELLKNYESFLRALAGIWEVIYGISSLKDPGLGDAAIRGLFIAKIRKGSVPTPGVNPYDQPSAFVVDRHKTRLFESAVKSPGKDFGAVKFGEIDHKPDGDAKASSAEAETEAPEAEKPEAIFKNPYEFPPEYFISTGSAPADSTQTPKEGNTHVIVNERAYDARKATARPIKDIPQG